MFILIYIKNYINNIYLESIFPYTDFKGVSTYGNGKKE